jgi:hypothetical protein
MLRLGPFSRHRSRYRRFSYVEPKYNENISYQPKKMKGVLKKTHLWPKRRVWRRLGPLPPILTLRALAVVVVSGGVSWLVVVVTWHVVVVVLVGQLCGYWWWYVVVWLW